jgi:hypothetical protein
MHGEEKCTELIFSRLKRQDKEIAKLQEMLQASPDEQDRKADKVFKQNYLALCIRKYFYMFGLFTGS